MSVDKVLNGRVATEEDVEAGRVVFYIPEGRSTLYRFHEDLPLTAKFISEENGIVPVGSEVTIVQAEVGDIGDTILGLIFEDGSEGICRLEEVELIQ